MTSMPQDFKKTFKFYNIIGFLVPFEFLSHYPNIDSTHWFKEKIDMDHR